MKSASNKPLMDKIVAAELAWHRSAADQSVDEPPLRPLGKQPGRAARLRPSPVGGPAAGGEVVGSAQQPQTARNRRPLPGPRSLPLLGLYGNLLSFLYNPLGFMSRLHHQYGEIVTLARGTTKYVFVFTPEYNQLVLGNTSLFHNLDAESSPLRVPPGSALSRLFAGLTRMNGERHQAQRHLMMPALQKKSVAAYDQDIYGVVEHHLSSWQIGQTRDLYQEMRELTLAVAVKTLVGLDLHDGGGELCRLLDRWMGLVFSASALLLPLNLPGLPYHELLRVSEQLETFIRRLIDRKRRAGLRSRDVLSRLLQVHDEDQGRLTDNELIGQTNFLFMAGHATTASALTWALFLLTQHPEILARTLAEMDDVLQGGEAMGEALDRLPYLEAVLKETLRLLPPVLWWGRVSTAPCQLGGHELPSGALVIHSAYITHRQAARYPQPAKFLPERWRTADAGAYEYLPFSAGPRKCLGAAFAMMEMKMVLALILRRFRLSSPERARIDLSGLMLSAPKRGMPMLIDRLDRKLRRAEVSGNIRTIVDLG